MPQTTLFGDQVESQDFTVYHDESGGYGTTKWVYTGLFWINKGDITEICEDLEEIRQNESYYGEIHFKEFQKSFSGEFSGKTRVAKGWFNLWKNKWSKKSFFNVLAVDIQHPMYQNGRFPKGFHAYNRFTLMTIKGGISWFFKNCCEINLDIYSDEKTRRSEGVIPEGIENDNFENYLKWQIEIQKEHGPTIHIPENVKCVKCPKRGSYAPENELLQLTDLLLGSVSTAVEARANKETKIWFGKEAAKVMQDIRLKPWEQKFNLHRKFSLSYFPDEFGQIYEDGPINIMNTQDKRQKTFSFY